MGFPATAKAPGKILWLGGYAVVEKGNSSLVSTVNAYVNANVTSTNSSAMVLNAPDLNMKAEGTVDLSSGVVSINAQKELGLLTTSVETALRYLAGNGVKITGINLSTKNDGPFSVQLSSGKISKSGLGSSAAVTVATIKAILKTFENKEPDLDIIHKLAQLAHSMATGKVGSGFDIAAATYGSMIYRRCSPQIISSLQKDYTNEELVKLVASKWDCYVERFELPEQFGLVFANFIGEAMITAKAVGSVNEFKKNNPEKYMELIKAIDNETVSAIDAVKMIKKGKDSLAEFKAAFDKGRALTKTLGELSNVSIEPDDCTALIEESKRNGAFVAKLPGAGGKDSIAALTTETASSKKLIEFWGRRKDLDILNISFNKSM